MTLVHICALAALLASLIVMAATFEGAYPKYPISVITVMGGFLAMWTIVLVRVLGSWGDDSVSNLAQAYGEAHEHDRQPSVITPEHTCTCGHHEREHEDAGCMHVFGYPTKCICSAFKEHKI